MSTVRKIRSARRDRRCSSRAMSSLPVPFSPSIRTLASVGAARSTTLITRRISSDARTISRPPAATSCKTWFFCRSTVDSRRLWRSLTAAETVAVTFSFCQGLAMKSVAPRFIASTAVLTLPCAVIMTTTMSGSISRMRSSQASPCMPEDSPGPKFMSRSTASMSCRESSAGISSGLRQVRTSANERRSRSLPAVRMSSSSSTISMFPDCAIAPPRLFEIVHRLSVSVQFRASRFSLC